MHATSQSETFIEPSRVAVACAALLTLATAVLAAALFLWGQPLLLAWITDPMASPEVHAVRSARLAAAILALMVFMCFGLAVWLGAVAWRIHIQGVFPPTAYPVLTKTLQLHGTAAKRKALQHASACAITLLLGVAVLAALFYFLPLLETLRNLR